jgi:predicted dehydrogenase
MINAAIIGCGLVADQHAAQISSISGAKIVAVCDTEPLMARQLADRFHVPRHFTSVSDMLKEARPDVVHITTPAQSHFPLAQTCLEAGSHVYVEKPFTVTADQAAELLALAESRGLKVTVGHNLQFNPEAIRMRELVRSGFLGGAPLHIECVQSFSHDDPTYGKTLLGDRTHWVRSLPGSLLHNLISHGLAKVAEYLPADRPKVIAHMYSSPYLQRIGQTDVVDELRAVIHDGGNTTAYFTFSTQLGAAGNRIVLHGRKGSVMADSASRLFLPVKPVGFKSYLRYFFAPLVYSRQYARNSWFNIRQFIKSDFHSDYGMRKLTEAFYHSIETGAPVPLPYREIMTTARMMDDIFAQIPKQVEMVQSAAGDRVREPAVIAA